MIKGFYTNYSYVAYVDRDVDGDKMEFVSDEEAREILEEEDDD